MSKVDTWKLKEQISAVSQAVEVLKGNSGALNELHSELINISNYVDEIRQLSVEDSALSEEIDSICASIDADLSSAFNLINDATLEFDSLDDELNKLYDFKNEEFS